MTKSIDQKKINIFFLPFAGGSSYAYREFQKNAPGFLRVLPLDLPGHGKRFSEPLLTDIHDMAGDIFDQMAGHVHEPYVVFGHSLGALLGFLTVKRILREGLPGPGHLFFSGRGGPSVSSAEAAWHSLPEPEFLEKLERLGGSPREVLADRELMGLFLPVIRADMKAIYDYEYRRDGVFEMPVTVMIGDGESTCLEDALKWQQETSVEISVKRFPGGHFFIFEHVNGICRIFSEALAGHARPGISRS